MPTIKTGGVWGTDIIISVRAISTFDPQTSGTMTVILRLEHDGADEDGYYWDVNDNTWQPHGSVVTWPTTTTQDHGQFRYILPDAAVTGHEGGHIQATMTDNQGTPGSETVRTVAVEYDIVAAEASPLREIICHAQDSAAAALSGVRVVVRNSANDAVITKGSTDASGDLYLALEDGSYSFSLTKAGYTFTTPTTVAVTADATATISAS